jgi:hypothetical protein
LSLLDPNILLKTLSLRSSLNVSDQVSHPYKTTGKIIVLYILIYTLLNRKLEDKRFCMEWQHESALPNSKRNVKTGKVWQWENPG